MMELFVETPVSFLVNEDLGKKRELYRERQIGLPELEEAQDAAIAQLVEQQREAKLPVLTQGALRRTNGIRDFWLNLNGISETLVLGGHVFQDQNSGEVVPKVTGKIESNVNNKFYNHFSFLQNRAGQGVAVRLDLPAPALLLLDVVRNGWIDYPEYKTNVDTLVEDIGKAYNDSLQHLYEMGLRRVMLIDRSWQRLCDSDGARRLLQGGINIDEFMVKMRRVNDLALANLPADMYIILDVPVNVNISEKCSEVLDVLFGHENVKAYMFAYPKDNEEAVSLLRFFPEGKDLILGVVDAKHPQLEDMEEIRQRIKKVEQSLPLKRMGITTIGGFRGAPDMWDCTAFTPEDQWHKIAQLQQI